MVRTSPSVSARYSGAHKLCVLCGSSAPMPSEIRKEGRLFLAGAAAGLLQALLAGGDPRHHGPELGADLLDLELGGLAPVLVEVRAPILVLGDPLLGEAAVLD